MTTNLHPSANGRGRTLWEILTGQNKKDLTPLELQYHNPLKAKIGCTIQFENVLEYSGVNFVIEAVVVYKTTIRGKDYYQTDYCCKGNALDWDRPRRVRLRLIPDEDIANQLGHQCQLLKHYAEFEYDEGFETLAMNNGDHDPKWDEEGEVTFKINYDDDDNEMEEPWRYWRVEDAVDPYESRVTTLADDDGDNVVEEHELEHHSVSYWDFHRTVVDEDGNESTEYLVVERDDESRYFTLLKGGPIHARSITVI